MTILSARYSHSRKVDGDTLLQPNGVQFKDDAVLVLQVRNCCGSDD